MKTIKTIEIVNRETAHRFTTGFTAARAAKRLVAISVGAVVAICVPLRAPAQAGTVYSVNIVGCVPDMTTYLFTAPLTMSQRQALHAQNFSQLPPSARAPYLHAVAFDVVSTVASGGKPPTSAILAEHLQSVTSIYEAPTIPADYSQLVGAKMVPVNQALQQLNLGIAGAIANNTTFQQAMYAGAVDGFYDYFDWWM